MVASTSLAFFSAEYHRLGDKHTLGSQISQITGVPVEVLNGGALDKYTVSDRKQWMAGRQTTLEEDMAFSLIGLLGLSMEFRYGEGKDRALMRLEEELRNSM